MAGEITFDKAGYDLQFTNVINEVVRHCRVKHSSVRLRRARPEVVFEHGYKVFDVRGTDWPWWHGETTPYVDVLP